MRLHSRPNHMSCHRTTGSRASTLKMSAFGTKDCQTGQSVQSSHPPEHRDRNSTPQTPRIRNVNIGISSESAPEIMNNYSKTYKGGCAWKASDTISICPKRSVKFADVLSIIGLQETGEDALRKTYPLSHSRQKYR